MQVSNSENNRHRTIPNEEHPLGNFHGKKVKKSCCDYCECITTATTAIFGATIASYACYEMFLETTNSTPLLAVSFTVFSLSSVALGGIIGAAVGSALFNPIQF